MLPVREWIKRDEGLRLFIYQCPESKWTAGYGRNLSDNGISAEEADFLLDNDIQRCIKELLPFPWYLDQPQPVKNALVNMCFNLGITRLLKFKKMIAALEVNDYTEAAKEALDSRWAKQVGARAINIAHVMRGPHGT